MIIQLLVDSVRHNWFLTFGIALVLVGSVQLLLEWDAKGKKVRSLGGRAPTVGSGWLPFGIGFLWSNVRRAMRHDDYSFWSESFARWGAPMRPWTFETRALGTRIVYTADEDNIKAVLSAQFEDFGKGEDFRRGFHDFLGDSVFTTDGQQWRAYRRLVRPQFTKHRVSDLDVLERHVQVFLPLLCASATVDVMDLFLRLSLDTFTHSFLGESAGSLHNPDNALAYSFNEVQRIQNLFTLAGPLSVFLRKGPFYRGIKRLNDFVEPIIKRTLALQEKERMPIDGDERFTFLDTLSSFTSDPKVIRDQIVSVLMAGRDSTGYTMSWMFYHLGMQPRLVQRLQNEILATIGQRRPTYEDLKPLRLLQHTINETLRLYPPVPLNVRVSTRDTSLPRGGGHDGLSPIGIPKGTPVNYSTLLLQRRADSYSPASPTVLDHREFAPDRWESWTPRDWTYVPFSGGPRMCIGQEFATAHIAYVTVRILQTYGLIECAMKEPPGERCELLLMPLRGIDLSFHKGPTDRARL